MRKSRIQVITTSCRRCSKPLATLNRSITGADDLKAKYDRICADCITKEEEREILDGQAKSILKNALVLGNADDIKKGKDLIDEIVKNF